MHGRHHNLLATDTGPARRPFIGDATRGSSSLFEDGWLYEGLIAEHGFSVLVIVTRSGTDHRILFDADDSIEHGAACCPAR